MIGRLGRPLGQVAEVEATVVRGDVLGDKGSAGLYLLRVTRVDGRALAEPVVINFGVPGFVESTLASHPFALYEKVHGKPTGSLTADQVAAMERGYVGRAVRLAAYETGGFDGMPALLPVGSPQWQDRGYGFRTDLVVLIDRAAGR